MYHLKASTKTGKNYLEVPTYQKISGLRLFHSLGYKNVAYLYDYPDNSTFRYRAYNMCEALSYSVKWHGEFFFESELEILQRNLEYIDILIIIRYAMTERLKSLIVQADMKKIILVYDIDDLVFSPSYKTVIFDTLLDGSPSDKQREYWNEETNRQFETANSCDQFCCTNGYLQNHIEALFQRPCQNYKNFYNEEQGEVSEFYYSQKMQENSDLKFLIGYFSGTSSHNKDFRVVSEALLQFMSERENVLLKIVGYLELPQQFEHLKQKKRILYTPFMDYVKLQKEIAECDINLIPLQNNDFTNSKSELKYFEAAIAGVVSIATPTYVYQNCITDGMNGYLAENNWYDKLNQYYCMDVQKRSEMQKMACKSAENVYAWNRQTPMLEEMLDGYIRNGKKS